MVWTAVNVRARLHAEALKLGSQRALASKIGCSPTFLNEVIKGTREPSGPVLDHLGLQRRITYVAAALAAHPKDGNA